MILESSHLSNLIANNFSVEKNCLSPQLCNSNFIVPTNWESYQRDLPVDNFCQKILRTKILPKEKVFNSLNSLCCIKTSADGDCLLHAVALCLWGEEDKSGILRQLLAATFRSSLYADKLYSLFVAQEMRNDESLGYPEARNVDQYRNDFKIYASEAATKGRYSMFA